MTPQLNFMKRENIILNRSFDFGIRIISLYKRMIAEAHWDIGRQVLRCGTSIGANVHEAMAAQSKPDFISKMAIASKEAREANYWLRLIRASELSFSPGDDLLAESEEIVNILTAIVKTSKSNA